MGFYTRSVAKIKSFMFLKKVSGYGLIIAVLLLIFQTILVIIYASKLEIVKEKTTIDISKEVLVPAIIFQSIFALIQAGLFF